MSDLAARILDWHREHGRHDLPWQQDPTPYRVWVSEIMLQQTQVSTVIPYFERFMARFPDVQSLAAAERDEVLALWSGLGYYARARNLHRAARIICEQHSGRFPEQLEELRALPGIGRSTAGAILALACGQAQPILDGNVKRVLARYHGVDGWPGRTAVERRLWDLADRHLPDRDPAAYTQGMMDLGATLCTRRRPACLLCPLADDCISRLQGNPEARPASRPARDRPRRYTRMLLVRGGDRILLERRPPTGVWGGLWGLPEVPKDVDVHRWCRAEFGVEPLRVTPWSPVEHGFTHFRLEIAPVEVALEELPQGVSESERAWQPLAQAGELGLAAPVARLLDRLK